MTSCRVPRVNIILGVSGKNWNSNWWTQWIRLPPSMWVSIVQSVEGLNRTHAEEGGIHPFFCLTDWAGTSHLIFAWPQTWINTISSPGSQACELILNYTTSFLSLQMADGGTSRPPDYGEPIPHSKFLSLFTHTYTHTTICSISLENPD